jgi:hypothetical protein
MNPEQMDAFCTFLNTQPRAKGEQHNPYIPGKDWKVGDCYSPEEKAAFKEWWTGFAQQRPDIVSQLPMRN